MLTNDILVITCSLQITVKQNTQLQIGLFKELLSGKTPINQFTWNVIVAQFKNEIAVLQFSKTGELVLIPKADFEKENFFGEIIVPLE